MLDPDPGAEIKIEFYFVMKDTKCKDQSILHIFTGMRHSENTGFDLQPRLSSLSGVSAIVFDFRIINYLSDITLEI